MSLIRKIQNSERFKSAVSGIKILIQTWLYWFQLSDLNLNFLICKIRLKIVPTCNEKLQVNGLALCSASVLTP